MNLLINTAVKYACRKDYAAFLKHTTEASDIQRAILNRYLRDNEGTLFGKKHGFRSIRTRRDYRAAVPVTEYDDYRPYLKGRIDSRGTTMERIILFEPTSGTSSGVRYIPYTKGLKLEFRRAVNSWLFDLYANYPGLIKGKSYWAISPVIERSPPFASDVPVGFEDDSEYLGPVGRIINSVFAVPQGLRLERSLPNFRYLTSFHMLAAADLALISVWNPTFLLLILDFMIDNLPALIRDLRDGVVRTPEANEPRRGGMKGVSIRKNRARAEAIERWYREKGENGIFTGLWPGLELISCWDEAESRPFAAKLAAGFPGVPLQGKGLLATEGIVTFPLVQAEGAVPAYMSHYLEFLPDNEAETMGLTELEKGADYTVLLTTGGGFYRYNLHDHVRVSGHFRNLPILEFVGRDTVCDLVGEKVAERHLRTIITDALDRLGLTPAFYLCAPERTAAGAYYVLYVQPEETGGGNRLRERLVELRGEVEKGLCENYHYRYAREIGQLSPVKVYVIESGGWQAYIRRCRDEGQREGDIKSILLSRKTGWLDTFSGAMLPEILIAEEK